MKLTRLRVEQLRQFRQPLEITGFEPGLNVFTGPNEAGKSTLVAAIRAAFFERHRSKSVDDLQPWGDTAAAPTIELDFTLNGQPCRLAKRFLGRARCDLQLGARQFDGADAEDQLAELLGFQFAQKGSSKSEHWGIPGLLWITQGTAHSIAEPVSHAAGHLNRVLGQSLDQSLGEVASSRGDAILAKVEAARNELLTPAGGRPRGPFADAESQVAALEARLAELDGAIASYCRQVDNLAALRREHRAEEAEQPWLGFRAQARDAAERLAAIQDVERDLSAARQQAGQFDARVRLLRQQLDTLARQEEDARRRHTDVIEAARRADDARRQSAQWQARHADAARAADTARQALRLARQEDTRQQLAAQLATLRQQAADGAARLTEAETAQAALRALQAQAAASRLDDADFTALRERQRKLDENRIRQSAAATRLQFALDDGRTIRIGDDPVSGSGERQLLEATRVALPGIGQLTITPGGADLARLAQAGIDLADAHAAHLARLGLDSLEAAEARQRAGQQLDFEVKAAAARLKDLAPRSLDALRNERDAQLARAADAQQALDRLPAAPDTPPPTIAEAEAAEDAARHAADTLATQLARTQADAATAEAAHAAAGREAAAAQAVLDAPGRADSVARARTDLIDTQAAQAALASRIEALARQIDAARPELLRQDVERFTRSAELHEKRFAERRDALLRLDVELQTAGALGLDEQRAEVARDLAQAQRRRAELARRAGALDHLLGLLQARRKALTRRLQAPLKHHLDHYLHLLFPDASLEIDERLQPGALTRRGPNGSAGTETGPFDALSFGAREQMGVISRLAYADLLKEAGRPTLIILDDALVHSDAERLAQMKRVLFDAATRHQILLFSCHPEDWRDLGVAPRAIANLRAPAGVQSTT
ncbi:AAA family ATPase [uncultured Zoogloea sp.]|uniref:AAA family ATPase n=1 Tax=uncultured Zoogloea sp. TaxID=160237 RepID=UPI0026296D7A|nr:AAA family ATPase [uncultured Zoogloea sp.]